MEMKCPNCGAENQDSARFCQMCARPLQASYQTPVATAQPLTMRLVYLRYWMWGCLYTGVMSLVGSVVVGVGMGEPAFGALMVVYGLLMLTVGIWLLRKHGTGWNA